MAFISKRAGRAGVFVYYHDRNTGALKQVPRKETKHLDQLPPEEQQAWVEAWEKKHGLAKDRSERINLAEDDSLIELWREYQTHYTKIKKRRQRAEMEETALFENHIAPFFVGKHQRKDPRTWHDLVPKFHAAMFKKELADQTVRYVLWALERFGDYLVWSRKMTFKFAIQTPAREDRKVTPLKTKRGPDEILNFVNRTTIIKAGRKSGGKRHVITDQQIKLAILIGYFASLRPSESFALEKDDFLTGDEATENTKTFEGLKQYKLGTKLSLTVNKTWQKRPDRIEPLTKSHYARGVVNVWHPDAAKMIATILKTLPDGRLFPLTYSSMRHVWDREVFPLLKVTPHDLRRASGLFLGRTKRVTLTLLQEHMRHAEIETTLLYTRDPETPEVKRKTTSQDFDDVV